MGPITPSWLSCWDKLRDTLTRKTSWGKNELLTLMTEIERAEIRAAEKEKK